MYLKEVMEMWIPEDVGTRIFTDTRVEDKRSRVGFCLQYTDYRIGNKMIKQQNDFSLVTWWLVLQHTFIEDWWDYQWIIVEFSRLY